MVYRRRTRAPFRKRIAKRRFVRRRRPIRRKIGVLTPHVFKTVLLAGSLTFNIGDAPTTPYVVWSFKLEDLPNATPLAQSYDEYRICALKYTYLPSMNTSYPGQPSPIIHTIIDVDDRALPTSLAEMQQYRSYKRYPSTRTWSRYFKPKFAVPVILDIGQTGTAFAMGAMGRRGWLDMAYSTIRHYGLKFHVEYNGPVAQAQYARVNVTVYYMCRVSR